MTLRIPGCTYRLQLNKSFNFRDATALVDYLDALGVTDIYASPFLVARAGQHPRLRRHRPRAAEPGDRHRRRPRRARRRAAQRDMGLLMDVVPNHMGIASVRQPLVERRARERPQLAVRRASSTSTGVRPRPSCTSKVLLPILGDQYGRVLENQELSIDVRRRARSMPATGSRASRSRRARSCRCWNRSSPTCAAAHPARSPRRARAREHRHRDHAPARPAGTPSREQGARAACARRRSSSAGSTRSCRGAPSRARRDRAQPRPRSTATRANPRSFDRLDALLADQAYRLASGASPPRRSTTAASSTSTTWPRSASRMPEVFDAVHAPFQLLRAGRSPGCASTTPTACWTRRATSRTCSRRAPLLRHRRGDEAPPRDGASPAATRAADLRGGREDPGRRRAAAARLGRCTAPPATSS